MDISNLKRDSSRIEAGEWVDDIPNMGGLRLRVRGVGSKVYQTVVSRLSRAVPKDGRTRDNSLTPDASLKVMAEAFHETILIDWDGITDKGKAIPYDKALALEWLTNPDFRPFFDAVVWAAGVVENGRTETAKAIEGN